MNARQSHESRGSKVIEANKCKAKSRQVQQAKRSTAAGGGTYASGWRPSSTAAAGISLEGVAYYDGNIETDVGINLELQPES